MKKKTFNDLFTMTYNGYHEMCRRHPKAAKKRRVRKKWRNRYGVGISDMARRPKTFSWLYDLGDVFNEKELKKSHEIWNDPVILEFRY